MSDDAKVPLPRGAKAGWFTARDGLLYTESQMLSYGDARERAARAAEREACAQYIEGFTEAGWGGMSAHQIADALRARAEGGA